MVVKQLRPDLKRYLQKHNIKKQYSKQVRIFEDDPRHPSLNTEILEPRHLKIYSFRIDRKYRAVFIMTSHNEVEIIDINLHYQ